MPTPCGATPGHRLLLLALVLLFSPVALASDTRSVSSLRKPLDLSGSWRYHAGELADGSAPALDDSRWATVAMPQQSRSVAPLATQPIVWFRCEVQLRPELLQGPEPLTLAVTFGPLFGSAEFFANGTLIGRRGLIDPVPKESARFVSYHEIPPGLIGPDGRLVLAARTWQPPLLRDPWSEYSLRFWPGLYILGHASDVAARSELEETRLHRLPALLIILGVSFMLIALHFLLIYRRRRDLVAYLWYAIVVFCSNVYCLVINRYVGFELLDLSLIFYSHLGALVSCITLAAMCQFISYFLDGSPPGGWLRRYQILLLVLGAIAITPTRLALLCGSLSTLASVLVPGMLYLGGWSIHRAHKGLREARLLSGGFVFFILLAGAGLVHPLLFMPVPGLGSLLAMVARVGLVLAMAGALADHFVRALDKLDATHRATRRFVPFEYLRLLGRADISDIQRGDAVELEVSVLFSDIRGFTTLSEQLGPQKSFAFINEYLAQVEPAIYRNRGVVSAHLGDGLMALFHRDADAALLAAIEMQRAVSAFNASHQASGQPEITVGIGINSGQTILGTVGGAERLSCTQISDAVNLAARLEGMTKLYQVPILLSESTAARLANPGCYQLRPIDRVIAKGKTHPTEIYEVLDTYAPELRALRGRTRPQFAAAIAEFRAGCFARAQASFQALLAADPQDTVCALYVERCQSFVRDGTPAGWSGVTVLAQK